VAEGAGEQVAWSGHVAALRCAALRCAALRCAVLRRAVLCCAALCCAVLRQHCQEVQIRSAHSGALQPSTAAGFTALLARAAQQGSAPVDAQPVGGPQCHLVLKVGLHHQLLHKRPAGTGQAGRQGEWLPGNTRCGVRQDQGGRIKAAGSRRQDQGGRIKAGTAIAWRSWRGCDSISRAHAIPSCKRSCCTC
jgi:hypothetical protein